MINYLSEVWRQTVVLGKMIPELKGCRSSRPNSVRKVLPAKNIQEIFRKPKTDLKPVKVFFCFVLFWFLFFFFVCKRKKPGAGFYISMMNRLILLDFWNSFCWVSLKISSMFWISCHPSLLINKVEINDTSHFFSSTVSWILLFLYF